MGTKGGIRDVLERIAVGVEKMASEPQIEVEFGPPVCPHCGTFNPEVQIEAESGEGKLAEFVIGPGTCLTCGGTMYAVVESFSMHRELQTAADEINSRRAGWEDGSTPNV